MIDEKIYLEHGYNSRRHYLQCMAEEHNVPYSVVYELSEVLGESEDFDGLISTLQDTEIIFNNE